MPELGRLVQAESWICLAQERAGPDWHHPRVPLWEAFGFEPAYAVEIDPEFPGDGEWDCPVFGFHRDGSLTAAFESRWGPPAIIRVVGTGGTWVGTFAAGGLGGASGAFACPGRDNMCVVVDGLAYLVDVARPAAGAAVVCNPVQQVVGLEEPPLLLLVRDLDVTALGRSGIVWRTPRLAVDDLRVREAGPGVIVCACDNLGGTSTIELDPRTGEQTAGTRLDSFWPPDALA